MNHKARVSVALTTTLAVLALGGCGQSITDPDASGPATTEVETYVPTPYVDTPAETEAPNEEAQWISGPSEQAEGTSRTSLLAHDFRVGVHEDYYRVVVEFVGQGDPGWTVGWTDKSVEVGRGDALPIPQGNVLDVMIHGATWPAVPGAAEYYYNGPADKRLDDSVLAWFDGSFESDTHLAISSDKEREYRVFTLENPKRLVIDLRK
ncbi:AMIN-like domain-containing (lipo)protein [Gleimia europaea]|uniref:AMIN-like domain-containing protein n=1 Tax=Gleimia europaea ACS-120-V-Col10b TaxID=883069 RepID=A0A9W5RCT4_9ACTO|nr:AMIN domain-containing protein [Gleimia europaea]EPD29339.1 hypothetical protein HMPREF9238_01654 [Gleimia europaea ACS-120-V-Col10b]